MYNLTVDEAILVAKIFACLMGDGSVVLTDLDRDAAKSLLKRIADHRYDLLPEQRELMKVFVDMAIR